MLVTLNATAPGNCANVAERQELTPAKFDLPTDLRELIVRASAPPG